jgi:O-antigen biosynthesis protein
MGKYNHELDLDFKNSLSLIVNRIEKNRKVLEFGPANGRLTKFLKQTMACDITIVEIDEDSGKEAAQFSTQSFLGPKEGNIETYFWFEKLLEQKFDYIIFADVLEHLLDPETALHKVKKLLAEDGSILISIPNIAHNAIIIDLINNKFQYNDIGLLDTNHLKFFTYYSFLEMLNRVGLFTVGEFSANARVAETEFNNAYEDISPLIAKELRKKEFGNVYQFVFEVKSKQSDATCEADIYRNLDKTASFKAVLYVDDGKGLGEEKTISKFFFPDKNDFSFDLKPFKSVKGFRFDPIDTNCVLKINRIESIDVNGNRTGLIIASHNAAYTMDDIYYFETKDPHFMIDSEGSITTFSIDYEFIDYEFENSGILSILFDQLKEAMTAPAPIKNFFKTARLVILGLICK